MPPASRMPSAPSGGVGMPADMWTRPQAAKVRAVVPMADAVGGGLVLGGAQQPHAEAEQHEGDGIADLAERAGDHGVHDVAHGARQAPPLAGGDDDGQGDERKPSPSRRCSGSRSRPVSPTCGDGAGGVGHAHPGARTARSGSGSAPERVRARPLRGRAAGRRFAGRDVELRPRAEEDVRVAMVAG